MIEKVVIVGAGPAGLTASLYTARSMLGPLCLEGPEVGGQLTITTDVENFPGFPMAVTGPELINAMHKQAERFGAKFAFETVQSVDFSKRPFTLTTDARSIQAESVIISSGASARWLGLESEENLKGHGVSACATCDGFFFRGKDVLVVGGGDTALEEALFLTRFCTKVTVVHRRDELRASRVMAERAKRNEKIAFIWDSVIEEILDPAQEKVTGARLRNLKTEEIREVACDGVFIAIGHTPNSAFLERQLETKGDLLCAVTTRRPRRSPEFLRQVMWRIRVTGKLSRRQGAAVWPQSIRKDFWSHSND